MSYVAVDRRQRLVALAASALLQAILAIVLLNGLRVGATSPAASVERLIDVTLQPPKPVPPHHVRKPSQTKTSGGSHAKKPTPVRKHASEVSKPQKTAVVQPTPTVAPKGNTPASGGASQGGAGNGTGRGNVAGEGDDDSDLELIAGDITPRDYPRDLGDRGIGGSVSVRFMVEPNGRVDRCSVVRSSGNRTLDILTCRLIEARFRFRPPLDRFGRPRAEEVDFDQDWDPSDRH